MSSVGRSVGKIKIFFSYFGVGKDLKKKISLRFYLLALVGLNIHLFVLQYACCLNLEHSIPDRTSFKE